MKGITKMVDLDELMLYLESEEKRLKSLGKDYSGEGNFLASTRCANRIRQVHMIEVWANTHTYSVEITESKAIMPWLLYKVESCRAAEKEWQKKYLKYISEVDKSFSMGFHSGREDMCMEMEELLTGVAEYEY